jgi:hypothetical protein
VRGGFGMSALRLRLVGADLSSRSSRNLLWLS